VNPAGETYSLVDVNRAGLPLMEIVSEPDLRSAEEARAYLTKLRQILRYIGASRANMEEGNMRCEPNVSIRPVGESAFGQKVELKNINSFKHAYDAIKYEERRQARVLEFGEPVVQETRGWREDTGQSVSQRSKECADDYRYFPEPDLPTLILERDWVERIRREMPELPDARRTRFREDYGLSAYDANVLVETRARADYFEEAVARLQAGGTARAKTVANWVSGDLARLLNSARVEIEHSPVTPALLAALVDLLEAGTISGATAKVVLEEMFETGRTADEIVQEKGLGQITSGDEVSAAAQAAIDANPKAVADYRGGKEEALKFLLGHVMRATRGRANPDAVMEILKEKLSGNP
jgi:aspartyl-tRNA(Asn)/glutamyl-tRNA(Gln) amidotransferase subunit B